MVTNKRTCQVTALKALAITLVILGHTLAGYRADFVVPVSVKPFLDIVIRLIYAVHIPLFFTISGYLNHAQPFWPYFRNKLKRVLIPFLFFSLLKIVFSVFISDVYSHGDGILSQLIDAFLFGSLYWFCYAILLVFAAAPLLWKKDGTGVNTAGIVLAAVCVFAVSVLPAFGVTIPGIFQLNSAVFYYPFFALGYFIRHGTHRHPSNSIAARSVTFIVCIVVVCLYLYLSDYNIFYETYFPTKFAAAVSLMNILGLAVRHAKDGAVTKLLSKYSLQIMFFDSFFKVFLLFLFSKLGFTGLWITVPIAVFDLLLCLVACRIAESSKLLRILTGLSSM